MSDSHALLSSLAVVLCVAAVTTVVFRRLRQPVVFGYLLAGLITGPHIPIPLVADVETVRTLSELGVILLMFALGFEFSIRKLVQVAPTAGLIALGETSAMLWLGYTTGQLLGWSRIESVYAGAIIAISSTTIIVKAFGEQRVQGRFKDVVLSILIMEDLIAIFLLAVLTAISTGTAVSASSLGVTGVRLVSFLAVLVGVGLLVVPRTIRLVTRMDRSETTLVTAMGICFAAALTALAFGYSVALGAFIAGSLVAESGSEKIVERVVRPVRDMFAAIFFVAVGMMIDPAVVAEHWRVVLLFAGLVVAGKVIFVSVMSFVTGFAPRTSVQSGMSLAQIGEFSFIIAGVGLATGATRDFLYPVAITVSTITTFTTPLLIRAATPAATWLDRTLPHPVQTFVALYGSWIERLRSAPSESRGRSRVRRLVGLLAVDLALLAAAVIGAALEMGRFASVLGRWTGASESLARLIVIGGAVVVAVPLLLGLVRVSGTLALELALRAMPAVPAGRVDTAVAPRRALVVTLQLVVLVAVALPFIAVTRPFVAPLRIEIILLVLVFGLGVAFWRSAANLHGHVHAGAQVIASALARQMSDGPEPAAQMERSLEEVSSLLPGLGEPQPVRIRAGSPGAGKTLAELNLRGLTGATVLAIMRTGEQVLAPAGRQVVQVGDVLAVGGSREAIAASRLLLDPGTTPPNPRASSAGATR